MKQLLILFLPLVFTSTVHSQIFINGSFEINTATVCMLNIANPTFNSHMSNVKGIGYSQTLDIFKDINCPIWGQAQSGQYFISLENQIPDSTKSTAISLKLADTLHANMPYSFCYWDRGLYGPGYGPIEIGVSSNDSTFGTLIYISPLIDTTWTMRTVTFNSPITAQYVTARFPHGGGALIDNFDTCIANGINEEISDKNKLSIFPNPGSNILNIQTSNMQKINFNIYNSYGQLVKIGVITNGLITININEFTNGFYSITFFVDNTVKRQIFIVEK